MYRQQATCNVGMQAPAVKKKETKIQGNLIMCTFSFLINEALQ